MLAGAAKANKVQYGRPTLARRGWQPRPCGEPKLTAPLCACVAMLSAPPCSEPFGQRFPFVALDTACKHHPHAEINLWFIHGSVAIDADFLPAFQAKGCQM